MRGGNPFAAASALMAFAAAGIAVRIEDDPKVLIVDDRERDDAKREYLAADFSTAPPTFATEADVQRLRMAAERRARKVARQAKGFV